MQTMWAFLLLLNNKRLSIHKILTFINILQYFLRHAQLSCPHENEGAAKSTQEESPADFGPEFSAYHIHLLKSVCRLISKCLIKKKKETGP